MKKVKNKNKLVLKELEKDLNLDRRAFLKKYARDLRGPAKVAILVFFITKSQDKSISSNEIKDQWNKVKSILGKYNPAYLVRAREYGFLKEDEAKKRYYKLTNNWFVTLARRYRLPLK